ncbi:MAG: T9SS type A sorting domain-containing protein [bacterium]
MTTPFGHLRPLRVSTPALLAASLLVTIAASRAGGSECADFATFPQLRGTVPGTSAFCILESAPYLYVIRGYSPANEIRVVDISDPADPVVVGNLPISIGATRYGMALHGDVLYVGTDARLTSFDVSDREHPMLLGFAPIPGRTFAFHDDTAYVGGLDGLRIVDVSDPASPALIDTTPGPGISALDVHGQTLVVVNGAIATYDLTDPWHPLGLGTLEASDGVSRYKQLDRSGDLLFTSLVRRIPESCDVAEGRLAIVDVSNPQAPFLRGISDPMRSDPTTVHFVDGVVFLVDRSTRAFDVSDPTSPVLLHRLMTRALRPAAFVTMGGRTTMAVLEEHAAAGVDLYDVTNLGLPHGADAESGNYRSQRRLTMVGDDAYALVFEAHSDCNSSFSDEWIERVDLASPESPERIATLQEAAPGYGFQYGSDLDSAGGELWVSGKGTLYRVAPDDVNPLEAVTLPHVAREAAAAGSYLLVAGAGAGVSVLDPATFPPSVITTAAGAPSDFLAADGDVAVSASGNEFRVLDLANPWAPAWSNALTLDLVTTAWVAVESPLAAVGDLEGTVHVIDISDRTAPAAVATVEVPPAWQDTPFAQGAMGDGILYVTTGSWGLTAVDLGVANDPIVLGTVSMNAATSVGVDATRLVIGRAGGSTVLPPACPAVTGPVGAFDGAFPGEQSVGCRISRVVPNPAGATSQIVFDLGRAQFVRVDLYDVRGRHVRRLGDSWRDAGTWSVSWDGSTDDGSLGGAGVYFVRVAAGGAVATEKLVRLR